MQRVCLYLLVPLFVFLFSCKTETKLGEEEMGEFAPPDAYVEGSKHPYYGSENAWDRRFFTEQIKDYYKRRGQRQMLDIVEGRYQDAAGYCQELLRSDPDDLESLFNLAVARAYLGDSLGAMASTNEALKKGLPFERFLAGPRKELQPLTGLKAFIELKKNNPIQLLHGPMLGCMTSQSVRIWLRTVEEVEVAVVASTTKEMTSPLSSSPARTTKEKDYTALTDLTGLSPLTTYYYDVLISGRSQLGPHYPSFKTFPQTGKRKEFSIAFGGGAGFVPWNERMWDTINSHQPDALLLLGDNVYINMPEMPNGVHYYTYYCRQSRPEFRRLISATPVYAIWDDHDAATDDCWLGPFKDKPAWKMPLLGIFEQNWNNPSYGDPQWPACWFSFSIDDVDFFMLDGRFYRTNPFTDNPTMLGPVQKKWLLDQLKESTATFKVIVSPVPWALATKGGARDTWNGFKQERNEIFDSLIANKINGVLLLSADRHRSDAWRIEYKDSYPLYEFESSRLTNQHFHELMPGALFGYNEKQSFGLVSFDNMPADPTVTYQIISIDNEVKESLTVKKSEISYEQ
jgi:alkaline phosphatase D